MSTLELLNKVAEGSAAEAYLAHSDDGPVLVELSRPQLSDDVELYGRFLDEARARQRLQHPHVVALREAGCRRDGRLFAVTETLSGRHLGSLGPVLSGRAVELLVPLCEGLSYLHANGVVHGHLSPPHVFLAGPAHAPVPKLLDVGLLLFRSTKSLKTAPKLVLVPAEYLSPERICGQRATERSDVYGLGVLAFELVTGRPPFRGATAEETRRLQLSAPVPLLPDEAQWLQPWLNRCLRKELAGRYPSVDAARQALVAARLAHLTGGPAVPAAVAADALEADEPYVLDTVSMRAVVDDEVPIVQGTLEPASRRLGPYALEALLGEGGMGQIWLASHTKLGRKVAIKLLRPELSRVEAHVQRFFDEARAVNKVNHPHIVEITDFVEERELGRVWCVMEYLPGATLRAAARAGGLDLSRSVKIIRQVCDALDAAHRVGVVHRDLKPDNIFLVEGRGDGDFVKVLDFGVAKLKAERSMSKTEVGEIVGTPAYMSPEQALGHDVDARSDLYSLGTLLYVLLAGRFPFDGVTATEVVTNIVARPPLPLPSHTRSGEEIYPELAAAVMRCLEKRPSRRFQSMRELGEALLPFEITQRLLKLESSDLLIDLDDDEAALAVDVDLSDDRADEGRRFRARAWWLAAGLALALAGGAGWWLGHGKAVAAGGKGSGAGAVLDLAAAPVAEPASLVAPAPLPSPPFEPSKTAPKKAKKRAKRR